LAQGPIVRLGREPKGQPRIKGRQAHFPRATSYREQGARLGGTFKALEATVEKLLSDADVSLSAAEASPDRALVFEVKGSVAQFITAARAAGLEWMGEDYAGAEADEDEDSEDLEAEAAGSTPLYITMPTLGGLQKVVGYWKRYVGGEPRSKETGPWWALFGYLKDVRPWSAKDRVDPTVAPYLERVLERAPNQPVRLELDLWYRGDERLRADANDYVRSLMAELNGRVLDFATIEPIAYQAALVELPVAQVRRLVGLEGPLAEADPVMRVRPQSLYDAEGADESEVDQPLPTPPAAVDPRPPVVALLDGYPIQNHDLLQNRLVIHEVDVAARTVPVNRRFHGTSMSSLILHGDIHNGEPPLDRTLAVVPILAAPQGLNSECTPQDRLPLALVYRAVTALKAGVDGQPAAAPNVVLINHSICDREAPFARRPSYWAKLLDYLSHTYRILFIVSAGNSREPFVVDTYEDCDAFADADEAERQIVLLRSVERAKGRRVILSPAESLNALTVGAIHSDGSTGCPDGEIDPFQDIGVANLGSTVGLGVNRAIKPDLVQHGGRQLVVTETDDGIVTAWPREHPDVGQLSAAPDPILGSTKRLARTTGTSNAAALVTRAGARLVDVVEPLFDDDGESWSASPSRAVVLKALLAHGCRWDKTGQVLDSTYPGGWQRRREAISRFLGYGRCDLERVLTVDGSRITLLADDQIAPDVLHEYKVPIPRAMIGNNELRRITMTLAWSSPIDPLSQRYRGVLVEMVDRTGKRDFWDGVKSVLQPTAFAGRRGTLQHIVLEGTKKRALVGDGGFFVGVQARADLTSFAKASVPYALAITLEMAQPVRQTVFADVAARVRPKVQAPRERVPTRIRT
jgi:hypothetical protein